ncbi:MAG: hypothetical protein KKD74_07905 [Bacteroidetes bacterium]|nr:hypothetical protein [Bacteroidota bacterium]
MRKLKLLISLLIAVVAVQAQTLEVGLFGGGAYYIGDINPVLHFNQLKPSFGAIARYNSNSRWAFRLCLTSAEVTGDDQKVKFNEDRSLSFNTTINDAALVAEFNFLEYFTGSKKDYFTPFIFGGFSVFQYNPQSLDGVGLRALGTEGQNIGYQGRKQYSKMGFSIPFGFGFKYSLTKRIGMAFEWRMHKTFTDYIDDVSTTYYLESGAIDPGNQGQVLSDPGMNHEPGMQRGDSKTNDWFNYTGLSITYRFNMKSRSTCNTFNNKISQ